MLPSADIEAIAVTVHNTNRGWCEANGDFSQPEWKDNGENLKESTRDAVRFVLANPKAGDSAQHDNWMKTWREDGWVYGPVKDTAAKVHPCLVPFGQLPWFQQKKDALVRAVVLAPAPSV